MKSAHTAAMLVFLVLPFLSVVFAENMCIDGEIYITAELGNNDGVATMDSTKLVTHPKNGTLKPVGNKLCGFRIESAAVFMCYAPVTVKFAAVEAENRSGSYCTVYKHYAYCVCDFFACNSVDGMIWEIAAFDQMQKEPSVIRPDSPGDKLVISERQNMFAYYCLRRLFEYTKGRDIPDENSPDEYCGMSYYNIYTDWHTNSTEVDALKKRGETEFPMPEVCPKSPTSSPPPPAPTCPPPSSPTACPVAKSSTDNVVSIFVWVFGAGIVLWNQL